MTVNEISSDISFIAGHVQYPAVPWKLLIEQKLWSYLFF